MTEEAPAAAEPPPAEEAGEPKPFSNPCMDLSEYVVKLDYFEVQNSNIMLLLQV